MDAGAGFLRKDAAVRPRRFLFQNYRPRRTRSTLMSLGETPGMRPAWASVSGGDDPDGSRDGI